MMIGNENGFSTPPGSSGRGQSADDEEAIGQFSAPGEDDNTIESASVADMPDALSGVSMELLEIKRSIEDGMRQGLAQAAGVRAADAFSDGGNIQGVSIGLGEGASDSSSGEPGLPALTLYVAEPTSVDRAKAAIVGAMGVRAVASDRVPVNIVVTGVIDAQPHRFRLRPAPGGVSVGHFRITAGTIGCLAVGRSAPRNSRLMILSNNHVLANSNGGVFNDCIVQPGPIDGGRCPQDQVAVLERFVPINFGGGVNFVDCATGWAWPDRVRHELVYLSGGVPAYFRISNALVAPALGMLVGKSGRTTQLTQGRITGLGATINVNYGGGRIALFQDQIAITGVSGAFSAGGDSGSSIWTWNQQRNPVGLLFAGGGNITFANQMRRVVVALDINLYT
ncbi:S1 family peptidase [Janthinobacterium sp. 64]|uniref:S1 family peptidase n=1 Tax=Janthinobacterium sp. 64 TaxID=2035208 RepID=UPI001E4E9295|nr:S1 family peptidase [Janthinobacterium sp. 64]